ncbi:MAG TPA: EAL domain-containing protein [Candidatus Binatia bacterium]|nr:EAL domain-containing protein [Candidatus Binatia bacterium]
MESQESGIQSLQFQKNTYSDAVNLFQAMADNAPVMIWMAGSDMLCNFLNQRWLEYTGRTKEQGIGNGWIESVHPDDLEYCLKIYQDAFSSRKEFSIKYRMRSADGEYRWFLDNGSPFYLPNGDFAGYIGSCVDVNDSIVEISSLEKQNVLIRSITDTATVALFLVDRKNGCTFMNPAAEKITGYSLSEVKGKSIHEVLHYKKIDGSFFPEAECPMHQALGNLEQMKDYKTHYLKKNGEFFPAVCTASPIVDKGELIGTVLEMRDISEQEASQKLIQRTEDRFKALIENSSDVISLIDISGNSIYTSPSVKRVLGYDVEGFGSQNGFDYVHPADLNFVLEMYKDLIAEPNKTTIAEVRVKHADGSWRWIETVSTNLLQDPNIEAVVVNFRDITERKVAEEKANYTHYHDTLTDLPNRNYFTEKITELTASDPNKLFGLMIIDLDRFKMINESLGHAIGDRMIQEVSLRLANCLEDSDTLARLGGDEYGILLCNIMREEEIGQTCSKILEALKPAFRFDEHSELYITPSIGISVHPYDGKDTSTLLKNADSALYRAKEMGRNNFQYYNPSMNATTFQQLAMENTLRKALENGEFLVYYIPQIDLKTGKIIQVEALIRWMHPDLGLTFPDEFIPIAETTGLIQPIGEWVLRTACKDVKEWQKYGHDIGLSYNLSARQLRQRHLIRNIRKALSDTGFNPAHLECELTESVLVDNSHALYNTMVMLQKDGVKFTIDDFTTGHSSLNYIKRFPVYSLKVSHTFMKGIPMNEKDSAIANAIINLSQSLGLIVTAEGVERYDQLRFLQEQGCHKAQGYLFSPPVPADELLALLDKNTIWTNMN